MADRFEDRRYISDDDVAAPRPAATGKDGDPLAELAKLIGQTDPFANFGRANPTHPLRRDAAIRGPSDSEQADRHDTDAYFDREIFDEAPSPPAWVQHRNEALAAEEGPADPDDISNRPHPLHRFNPPQGAEHGEADAQYADGQYQDAHYGDAPPPQHPAYQNDPYAFQDDYADQPNAAREKSRRGLLTVAAVLGLAVIGTGGAFAYRTYVSAPRSGEVPVIKADNAPIKVVPPTSTDAANKLIQDRLGSATAETVVPREEQPVDVRDPTKAGARPPSSNPPPRPTASTMPVAPSVGPTGATGEEPRRIRTVTVKGDQTDATANPAAKTAPKPPTAVATAPVPAPPRPAQTPGPTASLAQPSSGPLSLNPRANPPAAATSGGYVVQVSSQRSEADARSSFKALQAKFPAVLGSRSPLIKRADLGEKGTYYRAVLGPFTSPEDAAQLCGNLKSAGGQCVVQRN